MGFEQIFAVVVFLAVLGLIISEKVNRTVAAISGALVLLIFRIINGGDAIEHIDFNTLGVLMGMMVFVGIVKKTGVFEYLAIFSAKKVKGDPWKIMLALCGITFFASAFLDNVTTVLLIVPMTFVITNLLGLNPIPFMISEIMSSNIGGTSTLIGDPPNIMIGSEADLDFMDFIKNLSPITIVIFAVTMLLLKLIYGKTLVIPEEKKALIFELNERDSIKDSKLLIKSIIVMALIILGFFLHSILNYPSALIAICGAALLIILSHENIEEALHTIEWPTIFFFGGLFVLVGALVEVGIINKLATLVMDITGTNVLLAGIIIIWFSAIISSFLDNIPFVATLIPLIQAMGESGMNISPLWWAVSLGACLGGNGTLIGASANVVVAGLSEKHGYKLTFGNYFKVGFPLMLVSIAISTVYLVVFYLI